MSRGRPMRIITLLFSAFVAENILRPCGDSGYNLRRRCGECISMSSRTGPDSIGTRKESSRSSSASVRHRQGRLIGHMEALGFNLQQEAVLANADCGRSQEQRDRRGDARCRAGPLVDRPAPGDGHRRSQAGGPQCRRGRRNDAGRHAPLDPAADFRTAVRMACVAVSHRRAVG